LWFRPDRPILSNVTFSTTVVDAGGLGPLLGNVSYLFMQIDFTNICRAYMSYVKLYVKIAYKDL